MNQYIIFANDEPQAICEIQIGEAEKDYKTRAEAEKEKLAHKEPALDQSGCNIMHEQIHWHLRSVRILPAPESEHKAMLIQKIRNYSQKKEPVGAFLNALLQNDLAGTYRYADSQSKAIIPELISFCWNELPGNQWGSPQAVKAHLHG